MTYSQLIAYINTYIKQNGNREITGGSVEPFILTLDMHYQSTNLGTPNKDPNFYA